MIFTDKKEKANAEGILKEGMKTKFWQIICDALKESKEVLQRIQDSDEIADLPPEQYKHKMEIYKAKKEYLDTLSKTPENIISWLQDPKSDNTDFDPYFKDKEL